MAVPNRPVGGASIEAAWGDIVHDAVVAQDIQTGTGTCQITASSLSNVVAIAFPRPFAAPPVIVVTPTAGPHYTIAITGTISAGACSVQARRGDGSNQTATVAFQWIAYGPRA